MPSGLRARALASSEVELPGSVLHAIRRRVVVARQALQSDISAEGNNIGRAEGAMAARVVDVQRVHALVRRGVPQAERGQYGRQVVVVLRTKIRTAFVIEFKRYSQ